MGNCLYWVSRVKSDQSPPPLQDSELKDKSKRKSRKKGEGEGEEEGRGRGPETLIKDILTSTSSERLNILKWKLKKKKKKKFGGGMTTLDKKSSNNHGINSNNRNRNSSDCLVPLRSFAYSELRAATRNFRPDSLLGEGGFGCVFKGWVDSAAAADEAEQGFMAARPGTVIAVKKLNLEGLQGHKEWLAEVHFLGQLHHPNLVRLIGYCAENDHRLLVYEFMPRGSLENHLFRRGSHGQALSWAIRIKVAVGAARGLAFLHEAEKPVIFRDFKTSNILLNSQFNAKLSDFGLAKDGPTGDNTHVSTRVMGTYGYAAPEYVATGHLTAKSDVYSFGVVLLEVLTGRRAVDKNKPIGEQNLVEWAKPYLTDKRRVFRIIDPRMEGQYSMKGAYRAATLALNCLNQDAKLRPAMKEVVQLLEPLLNPRELAKYSLSPSSTRDRSIHPRYDNGSIAIEPHNVNNEVQG